MLSVVALALAACGGDDLSSKSPADVLKETFGPGKRIDSGRVDLRVSFDAKGLQGVQGPLKLGIKGPFASSGKQKLPRFDFDANLDVAGQAVAAGAVSTGDKAWLKFAGEAFAVDDATFRQFRTLYEQDQKKAAAESDDKGLAALGINPTRWLADPEKAEEETVGGAETVHVTSKVDVPKLLEDVNKLLGRADATGAAAAAGQDVPSKLTDEQREQIAASIKDARLDVYSGKDDGTLRRLNVQITFDVPEAARKDAGGLSSGRLGLDLVISELNVDQEIKAPARSRPLSDLTQAGATGATGATSAPDAAVPEATTQGGASAEYRACLDAAGADIAEVQKCAPLLSGGG